MSSDVPSNLIPTRISQLPIDSAPSLGESYLVEVRGGVTYRVLANDLVSVAGVPTTRQVIAGTGLTGGGPLSGNVTLSVAAGGIGATQLDSTGVTPGVYGTASKIPQITVDSDGRVTVATTVDVAADAGGTVKSIDVSGGTTGLTFSGGPVILSGTITAGGTLAVANGGTGVTTSTGTGNAVLSNSPTLVTPALGTPSALVGTNITGTAAGLTAGTVTTNADLTGDVTSVGNATTLTNAPVIAKVLTGYVSGAGTVAATDSILQAIQKLNGNDSTNANLTGMVTSVGNAAVLGSFTVAQLNAAISDADVATGGGTATGTNTGDQTNISGNAATATLAASSTNIAGGIASQIPYQTGAGATSFLANGTAGQVLTSAGASAPAWGGISGGTF